MEKSNDEYYIYNTIKEKYVRNIVLNYGKILRHISQYIDSKSEVLQSKNPGKRCLYTPTNENDFYDAAGLDKDEIKEILSHSATLPNNHLLIEPVKQFYHMYTLLHVIAALFIEYEDDIMNLYYKDKSKNHMPPWKIIEIYFTIRLYSIQQIRIFKFVPNEEIMEYTVNNLNNRFDLASAPNLFSIFERFTDTNTKSSNYNRAKPTDLMMYDYTNKMNNRVKMFLKKIFIEFQKNYNEGNRSTVQQMEATNNEGKNFLLIADNVSSLIDVTSKKVLNNFIQERFINEKLLAIACRNAGNPSLTKSKIIIQKIRDSKDEVLLKGLIECVLSYWLISMRQSISSLHSKQFIITCSAAYAISNTNDRYIVRLKEILQEIMDKYTTDIIDTERKATLISFKKCIHIYMVLYIASIN